MKRLGVVVLGLLLSVAPSFAGDAPEAAAPPPAMQQASKLGVAFGSTLMTADEALMRSKLHATAMKGTVGEALAERVYLDKVLAPSHSGGREWFSVAPRSGPQGFDHIFIHTDAKGTPRQLMIAESKYGSSQLGFTKTGLQMGTSWCNSRLSALEKLYSSFAESALTEQARMPLLTKNRLSLRLPNKRTVNCWQERENGPWKADCRAKEIPLVRRAAANYASFFRGAAAGKMTYRRRLFHVTPAGDDLLVEVRDLDKSLSGRSPRHPAAYEQVGSFSLKGANARTGISSPAVREEVAAKFAKEFGVDDATARNMAGRILRKNSPAQMANRTIPLWRRPTVQGGALALLGGGLDIGAQVLTTGTVDWTRSGQMTLLSCAAAASAATTQRLLVRSAVSPLLRKGLSGGVGVLVFAAKDYWDAYAGHQTWEQAHVSTVIGSVGMGIGVLTWGAVEAGLMSLPATIGATASTGTAIASLHGAALTSASAAWWGGGSLAAGGGGVATGGMVVGAVTFAAVVATTAVVCYVAYLGYDYYCTQQEEQRLDEQIRFLSEEAYWNNRLMLQLP